MDKIAKILRKDRYKKGAISFDRVEVKFHLDEEAKPTGIYFKEAKITPFGRYYTKKMPKSEALFL